MISHLASWTHGFLLKAIKSSVATDDEAAAMAAMFQAQSANWEETQEKMSQLVFPAIAGSLSCSISGCLMNPRFFSLSVRATRIDFKPRTGSYNSRGGKPFSHQPEKPLPPSYVCYRCGQKGMTLVSNTPAVYGSLHLFQDTGFRTARRITIEILTISRESNEQQVSPVASSNLSTLPLAKCRAA